MLKGANVQTENGVSPALAGGVVEVTVKCGRQLIADGRAEMFKDPVPAVVPEAREEPLRKKMNKR